jgi:hypothetical protein
MTPARFRKFALSLPETEERPHFERVAFRTKRKTFCTMGSGTVNVPIHPADKREGLMESFPGVFNDLGGWTRAFGSVEVVLAKVDEELLRQLVTEAYQEALPVKKPARPKKKR